MCREPKQSEIIRFCVAGGLIVALNVRWYINLVRLWAGANVEFLSWWDDFRAANDIWTSTWELTWEVKLSLGGWFLFYLLALYGSLLWPEKQRL